MFVDPDSPVTQHNVNLIGAISSLYLPGELEHDEYVGGRLDLLPYERRDTSHFVSLFESSITAPYAVEVQAEFYRRTEFKDKPSRFACLFALGDMASCERRMISTGGISTRCGSSDYVMGTPDSRG